MTSTMTTTAEEIQETYHPSTVYHAPPHSHPPATTPPHPLAPYPRGDPKITYLCVFYHRLLDFRVPEAHAVLHMLAGDAWQLWPATLHSLAPYYYLRIDPVHIPMFTQRCMLVKVVLRGVLHAQCFHRVDIMRVRDAIDEGTPAVVNAGPPTISHRF